MSDVSKLFEDHLKDYERPMDGLDREKLIEINEALVRNAISNRIIMDLLTGNAYTQKEQQVLNFNANDLNMSYFTNPIGMEVEKLKERHRPSLFSQFKAPATIVHAIDEPIEEKDDLDDSEDEEEEDED